MNPTLQTFKWSEKFTISKEAALAGALLVAATIAFFKLKPYFLERPQVSPAPIHENKTIGINSLLEHLSLRKTNPVEEKYKYAAVRGIEARNHSDQKGPAIIERPLFDGLTITLKAVLRNTISSHQLDTPVEASITGMMKDETTYNLDEAEAKGAKLVGSASANMRLKRLDFIFSEMISQAGRSYHVVANAFDNETQMAGIPANYASGLASRLFGVGLDQAISLANQVGTAHVLQNSNSNSNVTEEMQASSMVVSQQATNSISAEATQDLRATPAELSLPAGTVIFVRLRASADSRGGRL